MCVHLQLRHTARLLAAYHNRQPLLYSLLSEDGYVNLEGVVQPAALLPQTTFVCFKCKPLVSVTSYVGEHVMESKCGHLAARRQLSLLHAAAAGGAAELALHLITVCGCDVNLKDEGHLRSVRRCDDMFAMWVIILSWGT